MSPFQSTSLSQTGLKLSRKALLSLIVLVTNGFVWFFISFVVLGKVTQGLSNFENLLILTIDSVSTAIAALLGAFFPRTSGHIRLLKIWMATGGLVSLLPLIIDTTFFSAVFIAILWGITLGFGMPASMEYLTEKTTVENRGRVGATVFFVTFVGIFALGMLLDFLDYQMQIATLALWRLIGLAIFLLLNPPDISAVKKIPSYKKVITERPFLLYLSAWVMFSLVNYLSLPILNQHFGEDFVNVSATLESLITAMVAFPTGILCDRVGRKVLVMSGFVMLGLGYAVLGVFPESSAGWYFYTVVDGIAWGILGVVFFMIIWGDLAFELSSRKYFALGGLPLLFSNLLQRLIGPDIAQLIPVAAVFSLASFFLFLAVVPLIYAPETLPEKKIKERQMKKYIEEAKKIIEKKDKRKEA